MIGKKTETRPGPHSEGTRSESGCCGGHEQPAAATQDREGCCGGHSHEHMPAGHGGCGDHAAAA